ncbi:MAG: chorismate mutase [Gammaproteobacteria bacterium]|nr:chorismate mutase [Gammaproteobacteria bacterium]
MSVYMKVPQSGIEVDEIALFSQALDQIRRQIDQVDNELIALIAKRARLTEGALALKSQHGMPRYCPQREREILGRVTALASGYGIDPLAVAGVFMLLLRQYAGPGNEPAADPESQ